MIVVAMHTRLQSWRSQNAADCWKVVACCIFMSCPVPRKRSGAATDVGANRLNLTLTVKSQYIHNKQLGHAIHQDPQLR